MKKLFFVAIIFAIMFLASCTEYRYVYVPTTGTATTAGARTASGTVSGTVGADRTYTVSGYIRKYDTAGNVWLSAGRAFGYPMPSTKYTGFHTGDYGGWVHCDDLVTLTVTATGEVVNFVDHTAAAKIRRQQWCDAYGY